MQLSRVGRQKRVVRGILCRAIIKNFDFKTLILNNSAKDSVVANLFTSNPKLLGSYLLLALSRMYYTCTAVCCDNLYIKTLIHKLRNCLLTFRVFRDDCFSETTPHINQGGKGTCRPTVSFLILGDVEVAFPF